MRLLQAGVVRPRSAERAQCPAPALVAPSTSRDPRPVRCRDELPAPARLSGGRDGHPSTPSRRGLAGRYDRKSASSPPRHGRARARARRAAHHETHAARAPRRPLRPLHRSDAREVPTTPRESSLGDGGCARLHGLEERLSRHREPSPSASSGRSVCPSRRLARRGGAGRLGALRQDHGRSRRATALRLRHGALIQPNALRVIRDARGDAELSSRTRRGLPLLWRRPARQSCTTI